jgi:hypothetical protein
MSSKLLEHLSEVKQLPVITLERVVDCLKDQALVVLCFISIVPFLQPIPLPGLSTLLGFVAFLQGVGLIFLKKPILNQRLRDITIPHEKFDLFYHAAEKFCRFSDWISICQHPIIKSRGCQIICGLAIVLSALFLSLPLPIPMSNFVPALSIALICLGLMEEDLILVVTGVSITVAIIWLGFISYTLIAEKLSSLFQI